MKKFSMYTSSIILSVTLIACGGSGSSTDIINADEPSKRVGIWKSQGSGLIVELGETSAKVFEITNVSCLQIYNGIQNELTSTLVESFSVNDSDNLVAPLITANETILFDRITAQPALCLNGGTGFTSNPEQNFDVFWNTFAEHYTYFEQRNIDWQQVYDGFRSQVTSDTTELELFNIFSDILVEFKDAHISVTSPDFHFDGTDPEVFNEYFNRANDARVIETIQANYLSNSFKIDDEEIVYWGDINDSIGYINFNKFGGFAGSSQIATEHDAKFELLITEIMEDFQEKDSIIIDVRKNSGGGDARVQRLASIFYDSEVLMYREKSKHEGGFTPEVDFFSDPNSSLSFFGKIVILTSPISVSSAEQLAINVLPLSQATLIGENTYGALSQLSRTLPNGWSVTLTNQVVTAADGSDFEVVGVPPHIYSESFTLSDLNSGIDSTLDVAIDLLQSN